MATSGKALDFDPSKLNAFLGKAVVDMGGAIPLFRHGAVLSAELREASAQRVDSRAEWRRRPAGGRCGSIEYARHVAGRDGLLDQITFEVASAKS